MRKIISPFPQIHVFCSLDDNFIFKNLHFVFSVPQNTDVV